MLSVCSLASAGASVVSVANGASGYLAAWSERVRERSERMSERVTYVLTLPLVAVAGVLTCLLVA